MNYKKVLGLALLAAAAVGVILSAAGLVGVWRARPLLQNVVTDSLSMAASVIDTTQNGLLLVDELVNGIKDEVTGLEDTTRAIVGAVSSIDPILDSLADLTRQNFPAAVSSAQTSLQSAQKSARLIDDILAALTSLPFSPVSAYKPEVPLNEALGRVSASLDSINPSLTSIYTAMIDGQENLSVVKSELDAIADNTRGIGDSLDNASALIDQYQQVMDELEGKVQTAQKAAPVWITLLAWVLTAVLIWLLIAQFGLAAQGWEYLRRNPRENEITKE